MTMSQVLIEGKLVLICKVKNIEAVGIKKVFDFEVSDNHNYYANNINVSNCQYHDVLDFYGKRYNDEFYKIKDTFITYKHRRLLCYPSGPNKKTLRGRCLVGSTLVSTNSGFLTLSELIKDYGQHIVSGLTIESPIGETKVSHSYKGWSSTIKIVTENGFNVEGTPEHPMLVKKLDKFDWVQLDKIELGDQICSFITSPIFGKRTSLNYYYVGIDLRSFPQSIRKSEKSIIKRFLRDLFELRKDFFPNTLYILKHKEFAEQVHVILYQAFNILGKLIECSDGWQITVQEDNLELFNQHILSSSSSIAEYHADRFERVISIERLEDKKPVYDVTVPDGHAFNANCLTSHNTRFFSCVEENSLISTDRGLLPIKFINVGDKINIGNSSANVSVHKCMGTKDLICIKLKSGQELIASKEHKICVMKSGILVKIPIHSLLGNEKVIYALGGNFPDKLSLDFTENPSLGFPTTISIELSFILGYLSSGMANTKDKYFDNKSTSGLYMHSCSTSVITHYNQCVKTLFGHIPGILQRIQVLEDLRIDDDQSSITHTEVLKFFRHIGISETTLETKEVPWCILQAPRECVISFLKALFECDARTDSSIYFTTLSKTISLQVQQLLFKLGLNASVREVVKPYRNSKKVKSSYKLQYRVDITTTKDSCNLFETIFSSSFSVSQFNLDKIVINEKDFNKKYLVSDIQSIQCLGSGVTYDMTVDCEEHAYIANGMLVSNSCDEIGWFENNRSTTLIKMDANEVYVALDRSLLTLRASANRLIKLGFDNIPTGMAFNVSSPSSARDKIMELVTQAKSSKKILGFKKATWEMNPNITKDDLSEEFSKDPAAAERDYGCNPPLSDNAFFSNFSAVESCFSGKQNKVQYSYAQRKSNDGSLTRYAKITDVSASTKPNVLAIDAGYCVTGDTLINTENGLIRIDNLVSDNSKQSVALKLQVGSRDNSVTIKTWHYMGVKPVFKIKTSTGHQICATASHPQLVLRELEHIWVKTEDLKTEDLLCINCNQLYRTDKLHLTLDKDNEIEGYVPTVMSADLAYVLGTLIKANTFHEYGFQITSSRLKYLQAISYVNNSAFGFLSSIKKLSENRPFGSGAKKEVYALSITSEDSIKIIKELGGSTTEVPWSILQADTRSQLSYIAACVECSGRIYKHFSGIEINSKSKLFLRQLQILLNSRGVMTCIVKHKLVTANKYEAYTLYQLIRHYMKAKRKIKGSKKFKALNYGVPTQSLIKKLENETIDHSSLIQQLGSTISYKTYDQGFYTDTFAKLKKVSKPEYKKIKNLLEHRYWYTSVTEVVTGKSKKVYDLTVEDNEEPAYIANGLVIHNSSNSFSMVCGHLHEGIPIITCFCEVIPNPGIPLNHSLIFSEIIYPLIEERNVKVMVSDRWQNIKLLQDAELAFDDLISVAYSLKYDDFWIIKQTMFDNEVVFPKLKRTVDDILKYDQSKYPHCFTDPVEHLALQIMTVRDLGNTVDKGDNLTDDTFRACCLAIKILTDEDYYEIFSAAGEEYKQNIALGYMASKSGASGSGKSGEVCITTSGKALGVVISNKR